VNLEATRSLRSRAEPADRRSSSDRNSNRKCCGVDTLTVPEAEEPVTGREDLSCRWDGRSGIAAFRTPTPRLVTRLVRQRRTAKGAMPTSDLLQISRVVVVDHGEGWRGNAT